MQGNFLASDLDEIQKPLDSHVATCKVLKKPTLTPRRSIVKCDLPLAMINGYTVPSAPPPHVKKPWQSGQYHLMKFAVAMTTT